VSARLTVPAVALAFVATVAAANYLTAHLGVVPLWPGASWQVTAGTFAAGLAFGLRDLLHRLAGIPVAVGALAVAGVLSALTSSPGLAVASLLAFAAAGAIDTAVYAALPGRSFTARWFTSNALAFPVDTYLFLLLAGFPVTISALLGQQLGKLAYATVLPWLLLRAASYLASARPAVTQ
jgi:uncharacterized PurR-regulated membrane protein YhhQ (DUF165 family)